VSQPLRFLSLFSGIGGLDLGLERAGMRCVGQVEIDPFCRRVLAKHWPRIWRHDDVRTLTGDMICEHCGHVDLICGGFPCQGISAANYKAKGLDDERSGLWREYHRLVCEMRPRWIVAENVAALTFRGLGTVLSDLSACGYDAEWQVIQAHMLGAPHQRDRLFIVAYTTGERCKENEVFDRSPLEATGEKQNARLRRWPGQRQHSPALPDRVRWCPDSSVCRVADGVPDRLDRYKSLGNAVVPQVAEWIGRRIVEVASMTPPAAEGGGRE
jgi:DNA (cytosine-5)-methyltransferase 1